MQEVMKIDENKQQLDQWKIPSDGVPIGSGTFGITIWNLWSNA